MWSRRSHHYVTVDGWNDEDEKIEKSFEQTLFPFTLLISNLVNEIFLFTTCAFFLLRFYLASLRFWLLIYSDVERDSFCLNFFFHFHSFPLLSLLWGHPVGNFCINICLVKITLCGNNGLCVYVHDIRLHVYTSRDDRFCWFVFEIHSKWHG